MNALRRIKRRYQTTVLALLLSSLAWLTPLCYSALCHTQTGIYGLAGGSVSNNAYVNAPITGLSSRENVYDGVSVGTFAFTYDNTNWHTSASGNPGHTWTTIYTNGRAIARLCVTRTDSEGYLRGLKIEYSDGSLDYLSNPAAGCTWSSFTSPIIGVNIRRGGTIDGVYFRINTCPCKIDSFPAISPNHYNVPLMTSTPVTLSAAGSILFAEWSYYAQFHDNCTPRFFVQSDTGGAVSISGSTATINPTSTSQIGSHTIVIRAEVSGGAEQSTQTFTYQVIACSASPIALVSAASPPIDMSTPVFGNVYQELAPLFTHFYVDDFPAGSCVIGFRIIGGDRDFVSVVDDETLHEYPYLSSDVGDHTITIEAFFISYIDPSDPGVTLQQTITVTVEPACDLTSFLNNQAVSTTLSLNQEIASGADTFPFQFDYEPASCNYIKSYTIKVDNVETTPSWLSISTSSYPPTVTVASYDIADDGYYSISITSQINTNPGVSSTDSYDFVVLLQSNVCSTVAFVTQTHPTLSFEIADGAIASTYTFSEYTYPDLSCGPPVYELVSIPIPGLTFDGATRTFSLETVRPEDVGPHEAYFTVGLQDHPQFNPVIQIIETLTIDITASCWSTIMQYSPANLVHLVRTSPLLYQIPSIQDSISLASDADGVTYCGARTFHDVSLTSPDHTSPEPSISTFDSVDTYSLEGTLDEQFGNYVVTFGVTLDLYPDFVQQDLSFNLEIVPDCATSAISQSGSITFAPLETGLTSEQSYSGFYVHQYNGLYADYCGPLEYILDPSGTTQSYLTHDSGNQKLLLHPTLGHPSGVQNHILRVQLRDFPTAFEDIAFTVDLIQCDISGFFADTMNAVTISPSQQNGSIDIEHITGQIDTFTFSFDDIVTTQGTTCTIPFVKEYSLLCTSGCADPNIQPAWIIFDPFLPQFTVSNPDEANAGLYTLTISAAFQLNPSNVDSDTVIEFNLEIFQNPCFATTITTNPLTDMDFVIAHDSTPTEAFFVPFTDTATVAQVTDCGPIAYTLSGDAPPGVVTVDSDAASISAWTSSGLDMGTYTMTLEAYLADYPTLDHLKVTESFQVTIDSICTSTRLDLVNRIQPSYFQNTQGALQAPTMVNFMIKDSVSSLDKNDGLTLCGQRVYELSYTSLGGTSARTAELVGNDFGKQLWYQDTDDIITNQKSTVTIKTTLEEYPNVSPFSFEFDIFFVKPCDKQELIMEVRIVYRQIFATVGEETRSVLVPYTHQLDNFFARHEALNLADSHVCGEIQNDLKPNDNDVPTEGEQPVILDYLTFEKRTSGLEEIVVFPKSEADVGVKFYQLSYFAVQPSTGLIAEGERVRLQITVLSSVQESASDPPKIVSVDINGQEKNALGCNHFRPEELLEFTLVVQDKLATQEELDLLGHQRIFNDVVIESFHSCEPGTCYNGDQAGDGTQIDDETIQWELHLYLKPKPEWADTVMKGQIGVTDGSNKPVRQPFKIGFYDKNGNMPDECTVKEVIEVIEEAEVEEEVVTLEVVVEVEPELTADQKFWIKHKYGLQQGEYDFCKNEQQFIQFMVFLKRYFDHPYPLQRCFSNEGELDIHFSRPLRLPAEESMPSYMKSLIEDDSIKLIVQLTSYSPETVGKPSFSASEESQDEAETSTELALKDSGRRLQTDQSGGFQHDKNFQVHIQELREDVMILKVVFDEPGDISPDLKDKIKVDFLTPAQFLIGTDRVAAPEDLDVHLMVKIPQQALPAEVEAILTVGALVALANVIIGAVQSGSLQMMWGSIHALQLTVHIPIHFGNEPFPGAAMQVFGILITVVTFDILETLGEVDRGLPYEVSPTEPYNVGFEELGYDSREPIGLLGTINFLFGLLVLRGLFHLAATFCVCKKKTNKSSRWQMYSNSIIRFMIEVTFELLIMFGLVFYNADETDAERLIDLDEDETIDFDYFLIKYSALLGSFAFLFLVLTVVQTIIYTKRTVKLSKQILKLKHDKALQSQAFDSDDVLVDPRIRKEKRIELAALTEERRKRREKSAYCMEFFYGLVPHSYGAQLYHTIYLFRRFLLVLLACRYNQQPHIQLLSIQLICLVNQIYLTYGGSLYKDKTLWKVEVFNDFVVMLAIIHANTILILTPSPELASEVKTTFVQWDNAGISLASIVVLNLLINQTRVFVDLCRKGKRKCSRWYIRAGSWDKNKVECNCECQSCGRGQLSRLASLDQLATLQLQLTECERQEDSFRNESDVITRQELRAKNGDKKVFPGQIDESSASKALQNYQFDERDAMSAKMRRPKIRVNAPPSLSETKKIEIGRISTSLQRFIALQDDEYFASVTEDDVQPNLSLNMSIHDSHKLISHYSFAEIEPPASSSSQSIQESNKLISHHSVQELEPSASSSSMSIQDSHKLISHHSVQELEPSASLSSQSERVAPQTSERSDQLVKVVPSKQRRYQAWARGAESRGNFDGAHVTNRQVKVRQMIDRVAYNLETMSDNFEGEVSEPSSLNMLDMLCSSPGQVAQPEDRFRHFDQRERGWGDLMCQIGQFSDGQGCFNQH